MPLFRRPTNPDLEAARAEAEAALPSGWALEHVEFERYRTSRGYVDTESVAAVGPGDEIRLIVALSEADAYRHLTQHLQGSLETSDAWAVPMPPSGKRKSPMLPNADDDADVVAARAELDAAMPSGWSLHTLNCEDYKWSRGSLQICGVAAEGPAGEAALVLALSDGAAFRALAKHFQGELDIEQAWAPALPASVSAP